MPIKVTCPKCQGVLHAPDDAGGKRGKCPTCATVLQIPMESGVAETPSPEPAFRGVPVDTPTNPAPPISGRASSFDVSKRHVESEPHRATKVPPPAFPVPASRASTTDPFARTSVEPIETDAAIAKGWRKTRGGLWWVSAAWWFFIIAALAWGGLKIAEMYGATLPNQNPGFLQVEGLAADVEIRYGALLIPFTLGMLCMTLGRLGVSNAPRTAQSQGLTSMAAISMLLAFGGFVAFLVPAILGTLQGVGVVVLMPPDEYYGTIQRVGLVTMVALFPLAELFSLAAMGRMGTALRSRILTGRASRLVILVGLILAGFAIYHGVWNYFGYARYINPKIDSVIGEPWDKLGDAKPTVRLALFLVAALVVWLMKVRLVGAGRRAIREWQDLNAPVA